MHAYGNEESTVCFFSNCWYWNFNQARLYGTFLLLFLESEKSALHWWLFPTALLQQNLWYLLILAVKQEKDTNLQATSTFGGVEKFFQIFLHPQLIFKSTLKITAKE